MHVRYPERRDETTMRLVSVNVGQPREVDTPRGIVLTSIFKSPVKGRVAVRGNNVAGDRQSDLTVHGGPNKAIYAYAWEHYTYWSGALGRQLTPGSFGENLTTEGLLETDVQIGAHYRVGSAVLRVTQPRMPCYKLALRFELPTMVKLFWKSGLSGIYFGVVEEGEIEAGDSIELLEGGAAGVTIADVVRVYKGEDRDGDLVERVLAAPLSGSWRQEILERRNA
jgi:MOSC domain-containing protein YiiM